MPAPASNLPHLSRKRRRKQKTTRNMPLLPPEIGEDDLEVSDEDLEFVKKHREYAGLISKLDTGSITRQVLGIKSKWEGEGLEKFYERKGKKDFSSKEDESGRLLNVDPVDALPVKTLEGKLHYRSTSSKNVGTSIENGATEVLPATIVRGVDQAVDVFRQSLEDAVEAKETKVVKGLRKRQQERTTKKKLGLTSCKDLKELDVYVSKEEQHANLKARIAELGTSLLENPEENLPALKDLMDLSSDSDESISQLAMLSLMAIFKDILPGYRIRLPTPKELEMQVSKEVKKLRDYEASLLNSYQRYVQKIIKPQNSDSFQKVALRCMCGLLDAVPHFNFREILLAAVIRYMTSSQTACRNMSCDTVRSLFKSEGKHGGEATVEAVQMIADFVKLHNCLLHPAVLEVFLDLSFDDDLAQSTSERLIGSSGEMDNRKQNQRILSKRQAKKEKRAKKQEVASRMRTEVESDFREASVVPDKIERQRLQTMTLSAVFETYFRVLKSSETPHIDRIRDSQGAAPLTKANELGDHPLLAACLEGLTKFSQLISVEYLGDLLRLLCKLVGGCDSIAVQPEHTCGFTVDERIHGCIVAFKIVRNNFGALNVDLREFYLHFYNLLLEIKPVSDSRGDLLLAQALQVILLDARQHDMQRVAAFVKRLASLCISLSSAAAMCVLMAIQQLLHRNKQCRNMLENDGGGGAVGGSVAMFQPLVSDPDLSGALSSILWELNLLKRHYHPTVATLAAQISNMVSSDFIPATIMKPLDALTLYSTEEGGFRPAVQHPVKFTRRISYKKPSSSSVDDAFKSNEAQSGPEMSFAGYFRMLKEFRDNEMLRREVTTIQLKLELYKKYKRGKKVCRLDELKKRRKGRRA